MSSRPVLVPYESFNQSTSIVPSGAWGWELDHIDYCAVNHYPDYSPSSSVYDIECSLDPLFTVQTLYHPTLEANISINLANYGGTTTLNFTWTYWLVYTGTNVTAGTFIPVHSQVGFAGFDDSFPSVAHDSFFPRSSAWNNSLKISHSGSTSVVRGRDPSIGYIALKINVTMSTTRFSPNDTDTFQAIDYWVRDIGFNITTPTSSSPSSSPIGLIVGATIGAVVFVALLVTALLFFRRRREREKGHMADAITSKEPEDLADSLPREGEGRIPVPRVGPDSAQPALATTAEPNDRVTAPWTEGIVSAIPSGGVLNNPDRATGLVADTTSGIGSSGQPSSGSSDLPPEITPNTGRPLSMQSSSFSAMPDYPPPIYDLEELVVQDREMPPSLSPEPASTSGTLPPSVSPDLARFASTSGTLPPAFSPDLARFAGANRDIINESLEARLQAAGYLPTDDPSNLTPEQWRIEHGVTRLELRRLQDLYARRVGIVPSCCRHSTEHSL